MCLSSVMYMYVHWSCFIYLWRCDSLRIRHLLVIIFWYLLVGCLVSVPYNEPDTPAGWDSDTSTWIYDLHYIVNHNRSWLICETLLWMDLAAHIWTLVYVVVEVVTYTTGRGKLRTVVFEHYPSQAGVHALHVILHRAGLGPLKGTDSDLWECASEGSGRGLGIPPSNGNSSFHLENLFLASC